MNIGLNPQIGGIYRTILIIIGTTILLTYYRITTILLP